MTLRYEIHAAHPDEADYTFYGAARQFAMYHGSEAIIHGPAETGKTLGALFKLHIVACKYPGASLVIARKVLRDVYGTVWDTMRRKVLGGEEGRWPCKPYGGLNTPEKLIYHNGSEIWFAGFDKSSKVLSAERDIIYINQVEECLLDDWEICTTRTTGRAGNMPYSQTIGDANPSYPQHWMYHRETIQIFYSTHQENPMLFDPKTGEITEQGKHTMTVLRALTGVRRARLLDGKPAQVEGAIYSAYNESIHRIYDSALPSTFPRYVAGVDWGFRNPGCIGVFGVTGENEMYLVAQYYRTGMLDDWWLERAKRLHKEYRIEAWACDPSQPAYIAKFNAAGLNAIPAFNAVIPGINAVQKMLSENRLFFSRDSLREADAELLDSKLPARVEDEFPSYVWVNSATKEQPVKELDHGMDMTRYATAYVEKLGRDSEWSGWWNGKQQDEKVPIRSRLRGRRG